MRRRLMIGVYIVCALAVLEGLGWVTWRTVRLEREGRAEAAVRLALWRMDSALTPVIAQEASRPYFHYLPFYPFERAYTELWQEVRPGEVVAPSPLLSERPPFVKLHFQIEPDGRLTSPQAPTGNMRDQAEAEYVAPEAIIEAENRLVEMALLLRGRGKERTEVFARAELRDRADESDAAGEVGEAPELEAESAAPGRRAQSYALDFEARQEQAELARGATPQQLVMKATPTPAASAPEFTGGATIELDQAMVAGEVWRVEQGPLEARWLGEGELALLRRVSLEQGEITQGVWLDWARLRSWLEGHVGDLLPEAELAQAPAPEADGRMLATIPAALIPGPPVGAVVATPARLALVVTWIAVVAAVAAVGFILRASMNLADRRGRFVSAVTHELRTPLTTFRLYSDMLAEGLVTDEQRRREYLATLQSESQRLAGIVENVLEYARLGERTGARAHAAEPLAASLERIEPELRERAGRCGMTLETDVDVAGARLAAPAQTVERILANLVDNACKYAAGADEKRLVLRARADNGAVEIALRDFGPGVPQAEAGRIFDAWTRARRDADSSTSGIGLGLSISRGLARQLGGDLTLRRPDGPGADFALRLPVAP
ncbi:MAG: sensor histidine kinase [Phycisphaerales bacterium JB039]